MLVVDQRDLVVHKKKLVSYTLKTAFHTVALHLHFQNFRMDRLATVVRKIKNETILYNENKKYQLGAI